MVDRRQLLIGMTSLLLPRAAGAQQSGRTYRIGTLTVSPADRASHFIAAFEETLSKLGYVKGGNVAYEHRFADGRVERLPRLAAELVALKADAIIAGNNASISTAKAATSTIPIVMTYGADPVGVGFVRSLSRPGGNITGLTADVTAETWGKRLELVKDVAPRASAVAFRLHGPARARGRVGHSAHGKTLGVGGDEQRDITRQADPPVSAAAVGS